MKTKTHHQVAIPLHSVMGNNGLVPRCCSRIVYLTAVFNLGPLTALAAVAMGCNKVKVDNGIMLMGAQHGAARLTLA